MGYYFGFHNTFDSLPNYELVSMYNVGNSAWYQAIYEDTTIGHEELIESDSDEATYTYDSGMQYSIVVKTSRTNDSIALKSSYSSTFDSSSTITIDGVEILLEGVGDKVNLASFDTKNNKSYTIYRSEGLEKSEMVNLVDELVLNLEGMDDWINMDPIFEDDFELTDEERQEIYDKFGITDDTIDEFLFGYDDNTIYTSDGVYPDSSDQESEPSNSSESTVQSSLNPGIHR